MLRRKVVWTRNAEIQLQEVLEFYAQRNKSNSYSRKLYKEFKKELSTVAKKPEIGIKTRLFGIRGLIVGNYIIFYEVFEEMIMVLKLWDNRQDPNKLDIPR